MEHQKIAIIKFQSAQKGQPCQTIIDENQQTLSWNDEVNLKRIIVVQLPRYVGHIDSRLQPNPEIVEKLDEELSKVGVPRGLVQGHIDRENHPFRFTENFQTPRPPSVLNPGESFTLTYYEARTCLFPWDENTRSNFLNPTTGEFELICANTGHQIHLHEWHEELSRGPLMMVPRNCSFWCRMGNVDNWDAIILCDPPLVTVYAGSHESLEKNVEPNSLYDGGYCEDIIYPRNRQLCLKPEKMSIFDDILFFLRNYPGLIDQDYGIGCNEHPFVAECLQSSKISACMGYNKSALAASFVLKKLVVAYYTQIYGFLNHQVSSMGSRGWSIRQHNQESIDEFQHVKRDWLRFRSAPIRRNLDLIFDVLMLSRDGSDISRGWKDWQHDFRWLRMRLSACASEYQAITGDIAALSNIITSNKAVEESRKNADASRRTEEISIYAFVLIPLTLITSIFSMTDEFAPGGSKFWMFFAVAFPFTLVLLVVIWVTRQISAKKLTSRKVIVLLRRHWTKTNSPTSKVEIERAVPSLEKLSTLSTDDSSY